MFTFGREHEKKCSAEHVRDPKQVQMVYRVIDAVHDLLEGTASEDEVARILSIAFVDGGSGVWEQTGSWLAKLCPKHPNLGKLWSDFANNRSATTRFRTAAFVCNMPNEAFEAVLPLLLADKSSRVRLKVSGDLWTSPRPGAEPCLANQLANETDNDVIASLQLALDANRAANG